MTMENLKEYVNLFYLSKHSECKYDLEIFLLLLAFELIFNIKFKQNLFHF